MTHDRKHEQDFVLSHEFMAVMLGVQRPTVSVVAATLQQAGLIRYTHGRVTVRDRKGLEAAACQCYPTIRAPLQSAAGVVGPLTTSIESSAGSPMLPFSTTVASHRLRAPGSRGPGGFRQTVIHQTDLQVAWTSSIAAARRA